VANVRAAGLGSADLSRASDTVLLDIGRRACKALSASQGTALPAYSTMVEDLAKLRQHPSIHQATVLIDSAIRNLCPENSNLMPSGAP
jgi:hypothetical protein